jgi:hypothetical protein
MTSRTTDPVRCKCGHEGAIRTSENDSPYSANWEEYTVIGLNGGSHHVERRSALWEEVFDAIKPTCPKCGTLLTPADLV